jgi:hypothetical protein
VLSLVRCSLLIAGFLHDFAFFQALIAEDSSLLRVGADETKDTLALIAVTQTGAFMPAGTARRPPNDGEEVSFIFSIQHCLLLPPAFFGFFQALTSLLENLSFNLFEAHRAVDTERFQTRHLCRGIVFDCGFEDSPNFVVGGVAGMIVAFLTALVGDSELDSPGVFEAKQR